MTAMVKSASNLARLNARLVGDAMKKVRAGTAKIVCQGDSMTYGHDQFSADRVAPVAPHVQPRVPVPYPEKMLAALKTAYGVAGLTVENRGYSGDTAKQGFNRWGANPGADLVFIMYGINDAADPGGGSLDEFARYLALTIERYNAWGAGVVVVPATLMSQGVESRNVAPYRAAAVEVARRYACPVFRADRVGLSNQKTAIYSDSVHFNTAGYALMGNAAAMFVIAGGLGEVTNRVAGEKTFLLTAESNIATTGALLHGAGSYASQENILTLTKGTTQRVTLAFYLDADAAEVSALGVLAAGNGIEFDMDSIRSVATRKALTASTTANYAMQMDRTTTQRNALHLGRVVGRGWHSVAISAPAGAAVTDAYLSALTVKPIRQIDAVDAVKVMTPRVFSVFDPPVSYTALPAASSAAVITVPVELMGALLPARTNIGYYQSAFAIVTIRGVGPAVTYARYMLAMDSADLNNGTYKALLLEKVGENVTEIASVTGPVNDTLNSVGAVMTFNLTRPQANYIELRIEVCDCPSIKHAALL